MSYDNEKPPLEFYDSEDSKDQEWQKIFQKGIHYYTIFC